MLIEACFRHANIIYWVEDLNASLENPYGNQLPRLNTLIRRGTNIDVAVSKYGTQASKE